MNIDLAKIIKRPIVTEKSGLIREVSNQVVFEVFPNTTKGMIKAAVEKAFNVKVQAVNTMVIPAKTKKVIVGRKRMESKAANWKKAVVTLAPGENIEVVEGV